MRRRILTVSLLMFCLLALSGFSACYAETAAITDLPNPANDDRPAGSTPELPRLQVELPPAPAAAARVVTDGNDLQSAINDARPGDVIALQPGIVVRGSITLPAKSGEGWITIKTNAPDALFPPAGTRVTPDNARLMPVIESDVVCAIRTEPAAHHYRLIGIEVRPRPGTFIDNLVLLGNEAASVD